MSSENNNNGFIVYMSIIVLIVLSSWFINRDVNINKDNVQSFNKSFVGKSEQEIKEEFGIPDTYLLPKDNIEGYMSYKNSYSYISLIRIKITGGGWIKGLHYTDKMGIKHSVTFILNKNYKVLGITSDGFDIDEVKDFYKIKY
jgi:hypothetical protein